MARKTQSTRKPAPVKPAKAVRESKKVASLAPDRVDATGQALRTNQGLPVGDDQNSLRAGPRGPSLLEDFILREKITHFDHERIPERVVHARGSAAHGYFQVYKPMAKYTKAQFLQDPSVRTPVFVRFSTVAGSRGSADTVRDVRGFSVKFYTEEGNYDLVGNNIPVFFIQDAIKFPDFVHAVKPEPHNEMPQAASAHDTFWDFVSLVPETTHMVMWVMSDRAIPRSLRMMEGFGVNTFRLINAKGVSHFVKFHWKPILGKHSLVWDEAQKLAGKDPDFTRRDLWESIEAGAYPEFELGVQVVPEGDELKFDFDILDATKLIPEELVPVQRIGKMVLNRNPDNFFAETEQVAFHPGHVVPGIDFSNDPLLQGRLFSYTDTQLTRLGGPNFHEIPINRAVCPFANNQRDGMHRHEINPGQTSYEPNSLNGGWPKETHPEEGGFASYPEPMTGPKIRTRSETFGDHFTQATLFWISQSPPEKE
ncbi:MAG: catalase, partial [Candidatus Eremiobacteraeota bacterium]|nr:catalase [Candidatus Eremiobacteraeota bacterium]